MRLLAGLVAVFSVVACNQPVGGGLDGANPGSDEGMTMPAGDDDDDASGPSKSTAISPSKDGTKSASNDAPPVGAPASDAACLPKLDCDAPALPFTPRAFKHSSSGLIAKSGEPFHRGHDLFINPGKPQTIIGKFTYGKVDKDLKDEEIDIFLQKDCASGWTKLGTAITTEEEAHATVEGVVDTGGRVYFEIPKEHELGPGLHRIRMVVAGDGTFADSFIDIVPPGTPIFVSDVDGTLTSSEFVEVSAFLSSTMAEAHESAAASFQVLAKKGYRAMYMTARPELLSERTKDFVKKRGFPQGLVRTTGELEQFISSEQHAAYKKKELALLAEKGLVPTFGFGNKTSDSNAYVTIKEKQNRIFFQIEEEFEGRRIESYSELIKPFEALPSVCKAR